MDEGLSLINGVKDLKKSDIEKKEEWEEEQKRKKEGKASERICVGWRHHATRRKNFSFLFLFYC
jgi:hypothetical protein